MKKYLKILIVLVALLIIPNVYADIAGKSVLKDDVPNNTYIIGEYMFTRNTNDNYNGQLTVQLIMLAARSINGNNLEDMIIYYKNARGVWINGVSGEQVTPPNSFYILTEDMVEVPSVPHIASAMGGSVTDSFGFFLALDDNMKGEVVCSTDGGAWEVIGEYNFNYNLGPITETPVNYYEPEGGLEITHEGPYGTLSCKIRTIIESGTSKIYSDYSNEYSWTEERRLGDVDGNGEISLNDAVLILRHIAGIETLNEDQLDVADVNLDGDVDYVDVDILRKYVVDKEGYGIELPYNSGAKYTITYNLDGGTIKNANRQYAAITLIDDGYTLKQPTKEGYVFVGWTGSNGDVPQTSVTIPSGTTGNLTYTANWRLLGDVDGNGVVDGSDVVYIMMSVDGMELPAIVDISYGDVNEDGAVDDVDAKIIQKYEAGLINSLPYDSGDKYTITYNLDGGELENRNIKTYAEISLYYHLQNPTKEGYVFVGWTGSNGDVPQTSVTIPSGTTGNLTYTANWALAN